MKQNLSEKLDINGCYPNEVEFANRINLAFKKHDIVIAKAPMQYGKTNVMHLLGNEFLRPKLKVGEMIIAMTAMSDTSLLMQNQEKLERKQYINKKGKRLDSNVMVVKMIPDFRDNVEGFIKQYNVKYIFFDECDYGSGNNSVFNKALFSRLNKANLNVKILLISATPYCALNAVYTGELNAGIVEASVPKDYFGVSKMLQRKMVIDIHNINGDDTKIPYTLIKDDKLELSQEFKTHLDWFKSQKGGCLGLIRAKDSYQAKILQELTNQYCGINVETMSDVQGSFEAIAIGVKNSPIKFMFENNQRLLKHKIIYNKKKLLLVVVNALSAGKDLGDLKKYVRLVIETRKNAVANGSQGLIGRICGYHKNKNIKIVGSLPVLENYAALENDSKVMNDPKFISSTLELGLDLSTQLKKGANTKTKIKYNQTIKKFNASDIRKETPALRRLISTNLMWEDLKRTIKKPGLAEKLRGHRDKNGIERRSAINTQRKSLYVKNPELFDKIFEECENSTIDFGQRFHRFRSEGNDESRLRIKVGIIFDDTAKGLPFYVIKRNDDGVEETTEASVRNTSCYIN